MKGRSHRLPINDAPDDWGDGSWTVDCVCGVNFDDGEEMVNCDECGVWVHTRCSRFKGDDSFACDKCKRKKSRNDNEEEVAQLLVELPTKTLAMDPPSAPSLRLWTEIPIHERAHVHGIPGGDPALFPAISSVFTRELWKCSGYVPKKFDFQYREFPCWDTDRDDKPQAEDNDNPVDRGADALFSLSKEIVSPNPVDMLVGLRGSVETASRDRDRDKFRREGKKREADDSTVKHVHNNAVKRETNTIPIPSPSHLGKRKKENIRTKDLHSGKKKARSASKIVDGKRRVSITSLGTQIESQRVGEPKAAEKEFQSSIRVNKLSLDHAAPDSCLDGNKSKTKGNLANSSHYTEDSIKKTKHKDSVAAAAYHLEDSLQKVKSRDNLAVIGDDSSKKVKPRVGLEVNNHHANDLIRKKSKDKSLVKSHHFADSSKMVKTKDNLTPSAYRGEDSKEAWKNSSLVEIVVKSENGHQAPTRTGSSSDTVAIEVSLLEPNGISPVKDYQGLNTSVDSLDCPSDVKHDRRDVCRKSSTTPLSSPKLKPSIGERSNVIPAMQDAPSHEDSMNGMLTSSLKSSMKVKTEASVDHSTGNSGALSSPTIDAKLDSMKQLKITVPEDAHENNQVHKTHIGSVLSDEAAVTELKAVSCVEKNNGIEGTIPISGEPCQNKEVIGSAGTLSVQESSELKHFKSAEEPSKTGVVKPSPASPLSQRRVVAAFGKSSPSTTVLISKSEVSGSCKPPGRPASPSTLRPIHFTKRVKANSNLCADIKKDHTAVDATKDEFKQEEPKKAAKEQLKSSAVSASKLSHMSRVSHATISKRPILDPKEPVLCPSPKPPVPQNVTVTSSSIETARNVSPAQNKTPALSSSERSERSNQSGSQQSPKVAPHSSSMHPPPPVNSSSTLSDEELALLLHQELNSSPRVPRVPRMRHASSIPQAPPTPASMLIKRTSGSGLKDHISALRRKNKEDGYRNSSRELIDETKKSNVLLSSSHGHRKHDQVVVSDACAKKEAVDISPDTAKRNAPATTNSGNSEATEQNLLSMRNSPGNTSDDDYNDDTSAVAGPATRTLPGLLDEIMSKGKRMTYEELCNAVLPHWNKLRKHNGERYAYSSHSQAVLDCLRNRNEWAQLVDRGPKTTGGRKKRSKVEEEEAEEEGEYEGHNKSRSSNVVEDFPKGKRKARKRRRLSLQGRGIREVRKNKRQQKTTSSSEEEEDSSPESSESMFSEESNVGSMEEEGVVG